MTILIKIAAGIYAFHCPGCGHLHQYWTDEHKMTNEDGTRRNSPIWQFNGDMNKPTFTPSLLNTWGKEADPNWQEPTDEPVRADSLPWSGRCHLFVTNGMILYCGDSWHKLKNQTVPMVALDEEMVERYAKHNEWKENYGVRQEIKEKYINLLKNK